MSGYIDGGTRTFEAGEAIAQYLRVTLSSGKLVDAGIAVKEIGTIDTAAFASGDMRSVNLRTKQGTVTMIASVAFDIGDDVYTAASGKVAKSASTAYLIGTALTAATADGDHIEVLRNSHGDTAAQ